MYHLWDLSASLWLLHSSGVHRFCNYAAANFASISSRLAKDNIMVDRSASEHRATDGRPLFVRHFPVDAGSETRLSFAGPSAPWPIFLE
jgi:hypothetical protein